MRFFGIAILVVLLFFAVSFVLKKKFKSSLAENSELTSLSEARESDIDKDGLLDWEESLWDMDPLNPDTDGDGILDGQEVFQQREGLKDDVDIYEDVDDEDLSNTALLARQLLTIAKTIQSNPELSKQDISDITSEFLGQIDTQFTPPYDRSDLTVDYVVSPQEYYNSMKKTLSGLGGGEQPELVILERAIEQNSSRYLKRYNPIIKDYESVGGLIKNIPVPMMASDAHLSLMNSSEYLAFSLKNLQQYFDDPVVSMSGIVGFLKAEEDFIEAIENLNQYFQSNDIIF